LSSWHIILYLGLAIGGGLHLACGGEINEPPKIFLLNADHFFSLFICKSKIT